MQFYDYQPGNGTRYALLYGKAETPNGEEAVLVWLRDGDVAGPAFRVMGHMVLQPDYFLSKMKLTSESDASALLGFLEERGHMVLFPSGWKWDRNGRWAS